MGAMTNTKQLSVNGIDLVYDEAGSGPRAFVLVHGFTGGRSDFDTQLPPLSALGLTVAYDQRGHGDSTNTGDPKTYTFDQLALDLRGFADALALPRFDLLGHSMGGMVALRFTLAFPERVASLVLMDTASAPLQGGLPREAFEKGAAIGRAAGMGKLHQVLRARAADNPLRSPADRRLETELGDAYWERGLAEMRALVKGTRCRGCGWRKGHGHDYECRANYGYSRSISPCSVDETTAYQALPKLLDEIERLRKR